MAQLLAQVTDVISRQSAARSDDDIKTILPWLRRRTELMPQLDRGTIIEVVGHCGYETAERDDVILRQGEEGQRMYVILRGTISVYIDASLTGEESGDAVVSPAGSPHRDSPDKRYKHLERAHFGKFIIKYENGKHFGEAALLGEEKTRNATIIADDHCDFLVIDQQLFDRSLKDHLGKEFRVMQKFVEHHPLFSHMSPKFKRLLELSLRREDFAFDTPIITQGDPHKALYFILSGQAKILIEPNKHHKQYPHLWPFEVGTDIYSQEFEWLRESRRAAILRKYEDPAVLPTKPDSLVLKRTEGYAASERSMQDRTVLLCTVQDGEILGDAELVQNLSTFMMSVVCTSNTQTLVLDLKNLERVSGRRNTLTLQLMKQQVMEKLDVRQRTQHGQQVPLLHFLHAKLTEEELPEKKTLPPLKTTKTLPTKEVQTQHMLESYLKGKAELLEPCVPGTLIYKDLMEEKARIRSNIRRRSNIGVNAMLREARRKMNRRKPRSRREIVDSLKEMIEAELVEMNSEGPRQGMQQKRKGSELAEKPPAEISKNPRRSSLNQTEENSGTRRKSSLTLLEGSSTPRKSSLTLLEESSTPRKSSLTLLEESNTPRKSSLTLLEESSIPRRGSLSGLSPREVGTTTRKSSLTKDKSNKDTSVKKRVTLPPLKSPQEADSKKPLNGPDTPRNRSNSKPDLILPQILEEREETAMTKECSEGGQSSARSSASRYIKREVQASSDGNTPPSGSAKRLPPLAKVELRRPGHVPNERWNAALKFVNERMHDRFTEQLLSDGSQAANDYETSEGSLQLLESRIKQFHVKHGDFSPVRLNLKLPKLRRFNLDLEDENQRLPKPGGKVWIKKRLCQIANSKFKVKGHEHIRYHMVPELPEFDKVRKMQTVMQQLMDSSIRKKQGEEAGDGNPDMSRATAAAPDLSDHRASFV